MKKIIILLTFSLFVFSCQKQEGVTYEENIGIFVPDSVYITSVSNLPNGVKRKIDSLSGVKNLQVMDLLENEVAIISSEKGVLTYSIAFKKYEDYKRILGEPILAKMEKDCDVEYALAGGHHSSLAVNVSGENVGNIVIGAFQNQGTHIISHIYESSGSISHGSHTMDSDSFRGIGRFFGNIFEGVWIGIRWIEDKTRALLKRRFCGCKGRYSRLYVGEEEDVQARVTEPIQEKCCEDDESGENLEHWIDVEHNFYLPKSFLEANQPPFKTSEEDCRCMLQNELKNTVSIAAFTNTKIDCACKTENTSVFYKLLQANNVRIKESITEECRFLEENRYSEEAKEFVRKALIAIHQGGTVDYPNRIIELIKDEKISCIHDKLRNGNNDYVKQILDKFEGEGSEFHIEISSVDKLFSSDGEIANGQAEYDGTNTIKILINSSSAEKNSAIDLARVILHEYIHAELFRITKTEKKDSQIENFWKLYANYLKLDNIDYEHHNIMALHYISIMKNALEKFHKEQLPDDYNTYVKHWSVKEKDDFYTMLAWRGIEDNGAEKVYNNLSNKADLEGAKIKLSFVGKYCH